MTFTVLNCQSGRRSEWNTDNSEMVRVLYHIPVGSIIRIVGSGSLCYFNRRGGHLLFVDILQQNRRLQHASLWTSLHFAEGPIHEAA
jgi:hypothetical protein